MKQKFAGWNKFRNTMLIKYPATFKSDFRSSQSLFEAAIKM